MLNKAIEFATIKHLGQVRKVSKEPYINHPIRVSKMFDNVEDKIIALLHDTLEDTDTTYEELQNMFGSRVAFCVSYLTHDVKVDYFEYLQTIKRVSDPVVMEIKIADIVDNLSDKPSDKQKIKYFKALCYLSNKVINK